MPRNLSRLPENVEKNHTNFETKIACTKFQTAANTLFVMKITSYSF